MKIFPNVVLRKRRNLRPGVRKDVEVPEARARGRDLDAGHARQIVRQLERLERRLVVTDCVVLGRDREVDARGDQRDDPIFGQHRRVEARARVHVEIAAHQTRSCRRCAGDASRTA